MAASSEKKKELKDHGGGGGKGASMEDSSDTGLERWKSLWQGVVHNGERTWLGKRSFLEKSEKVGPP